MFPTIHITFDNPIKAVRFLWPKIHINLGQRSIEKILGALKSAGLPLTTLIELWSGLQESESAEVDLS